METGTPVNQNAPLWQLNIFEFQTIITNIVQKEIADLVEQVAEAKAREKRYVYGIDGIAEIFRCSRAKANTIKQSGAIDSAIVQTGRKIVVDVEEALSAYRKKNKRR